MIKEIRAYIIMFIVLVLIQVVALNNIQFSGYINPFMYVLFIMLLPFQTPKYLLLLLGFVLGLSVDIFSNTPGIHSSATVFMAFIRPGVIGLITARDSQEKMASPRIKQFGFAWFLKYTIAMVICHHFFLFFVEAFSFSGFLHTILRALLSSIFTIILILISQYIMFKN